MRSLLASTQRIDEDRMACHSIWSFDHGVKALQRLRDYSRTIHELRHMVVGGFSKLKNLSWKFISVVGQGGYQDP
jgi:hypothetical protein